MTSTAQPIPSTKASLSEAERAALELLTRSGGSILTSAVDDRSSVDPMFRNAIPGRPIFSKLVRRGLVFMTEEEPVNWPGDPMDGFVFTPEYCITDEGRQAISRAYT